MVPEVERLSDSAHTLGTAHLVGRENPMCRSAPTDPRHPDKVFLEIFFG